MAEYTIQTGQSINKYNGVLQPGDTVKVEAGEYEALNIPVSNVTYESLVLHQAKVGMFYLETTDYIIINGFDFAYGNIEMASSANNNCQFINNLLHAGGGSGIDFGAIGSSNNLIENNEIWNVGHGIHTSGNTVGTIIKGNIIHDCYLNGLGMVGGTGEKYLNNIIYNCTKTGIHPGSGGPTNGEIRGNLVFNNGMGAITVSGSGFLIINNTAISKSGVSYKTYNISGSGHTLKNNIGYRSDGIQHVLLIPTDATTDYNCWYDPNNPKCISRSYMSKTLEEYQAYGQGAHSISQDPLFSGQYELSVGSPCIGTGEGGIDMGAYTEGEAPSPPFPPASPSGTVRDFTAKNFAVTRKKGSITGTITKDGNPLPDVFVTIVDFSGQEIKTVQTNAQGVYEFIGFADGVYKVVPESEKFNFNPLSIDISVPTESE